MTSTVLGAGDAEREDQSVQSVGKTERHLSNHCNREVFFGKVLSRGHPRVWGGGISEGDC